MSAASPYPGIFLFVQKKGKKKYTGAEWGRLSSIAYWIFIDFFDSMTKNNATKGGIRAEDNSPERLNRVVHLPVPLLLHAH